MDSENNLSQLSKESDESLSQKEMLDLQAAITNSKETLNTDKEWEEFTRQGEEMQKMFTETSPKKTNKLSTMKQWSKQNSVSKSGSLQKDEFLYTFRDMPKGPRESLEIVYHSPKYNLPIPTNPRYQKLSVEERVQLLDNYYKKIREINTHLARKSIHRAPYSKPIQTSSKCKGSLLKDEIDDDDFFDEGLEQIPTPNMYTSRAGRPIKRKTYAEEVDNDSENDSDFAAAVKKNKSAINSNTKITMDTPCAVEEKKESSPKSARKKETQKRPARPKKVLRTEEMFENLQRESENMKKKERQMEIFEKSLSVVKDDDENMLTDESPTKDVENSAKNSADTAVIAQTDELDSQDIVPTTPPPSPVLFSFGNRKDVEIKLVNKRTPKGSSEEKQEVKRDCPLCGKAFPQSEIEDHAATCENLENELRNVPKPGQDTPRLTNSRNFPHERSTNQQLRTVLEDMFMDEDSPVKENSEENFPKRRVPPPKPNARRTPKSKKQSQEDTFGRSDFLENDVNLYEASKSGAKRGPKGAQSKESAEASEKRACPICGTKFLQNEIEDHAASCENFKSDRIKCDLCNQSFLKNMEYEVHVKECMAAMVTNM